MADTDGEDRRYAVRRKRKLDPKQEHAFWIAAGRGSTLRALAAGYGVGHETAARIVREDVALRQPLAPELDFPAVALAD